MHGAIVNTLTENPILTLFIVIGLGYLLGEIPFFGFRFGVVGVLFVGLAVGSIGPSMSVPEVIPTLGLIIFIYTIGLQSGPEFFKSLRAQGYRTAVFVLIVVVLGAGLTVLVSRPAHLTRARVAGLYTGAMTNTPALAAVRELLRERGRAAGFSPEQIRAVSDDPVVAYSIAYPVGVIGVLVSFAMWRRRWKPDMEPCAESPQIRVRDFEVVNPAVIDRTVEDVLDGLHAPESVLFVMTTNKVEALDPALLRPGRIDYKLFLGEAWESQKIELYQRSFSWASESEARAFAQIYFAETMAQFQGLLLALEQGEKRVDPAPVRRRQGIRT